MEAAERQRDPIRVLLVEDNPGDADLIRDRCEFDAPEPMDLQVCSSLFTAIGEAHRQRPDVILLDLGLPDSMGLKTFQKMQSAAPDTPVIVLSGQDDLDLAVESMKLGAHDYLVKGRGLTQITTAITKAFTRSQTKREVAASLANVKRMMADNKDAILVLGQDNMVRFANQAAEALFGRPIEIGQEFGLPLAGDSAMELDVPQRDGSIAIVEMRVASSIWSGEPVRVVAFRDVTERQKAAEAMRKSEELFRLAVEKSPIPMIVSQGERETVLAINDKFTELFGYTQEDIPEFSALWPLAFREQTYRRKVRGEWNEQKRLNRGGQQEVTPLETSITCKNGRNKTVRIQAASVELTNLITFVDITESKLAEQTQRALEAQLRQAQKMEAVGTLAGGIAHDFNNILAAIVGYSELALADIIKNQVSPDEITKIIQAAQRAKKLIQQILAFSRKSELELRPLDLKKVVVETAQLLERTISKMISIELHLPPQLKRVNGDPTQIEQVLLNLASNAQDAMPEGGRLIFEAADVRLEPEFTNRHLEMSPGSYVQLNVSDTGVGIDKQTQEHIFEPFFTTKQVGQGTGLGLASAFGIVKSHGGHLICYSEPGIGTTFKIYFPTLEHEPLPQEKSESVSIQTAGGEETIMVVDDEEALRQITSTFLIRAGYRVITVHNGETALSTYKQQGGEIDLILLDLGMPGMGGQKCLEKLMAINPAIKVIIISGYSQAAKIVDMSDSGAAGYLSKPFQRNDLLKMIRQVLEQAD